MNFYKVTFFLSTLCLGSVFGQNKIPQSSLSPVVNSNAVQNVQNSSHIIKSNLQDTVFFKLEMSDCFYDNRKNNLPYYLIAKTTGYNQTAKPVLKVKNTQVVPEPHATVIKRVFGKYLSTEFKTEALGSICNAENLNHYKLFPFRFSSASGQLEELIDYEVNWQVNGNNNAVLRGAATNSNTTNSVLASGTWYKIGVTQSGIYKINKTFLSTMGIDLSKLDPSKIRIYGNGGKMLPEKNSDFRYDDLIENPIQLVMDTTPLFDNNDYILFYATGPTEWKKNKSGSKLKFQATKNLYSDTSFYFLNTDLGVGKRIVSMPSSLLTPNVSSNSYDYYNFHEENIFNFTKSGRNFYGEYFDLTTSYLFNWIDGDFIINDSIIAETSLMSRSNDSTKYAITGNGLNYVVGTGGVNVNYYLSDYGAENAVTGTAMNSNGSSLAITVTKLTANSIGWLDKLTVNARRQLKLNSKQFQFRDSRVSKPGNICGFSISVSINTVTPVLWNVTDPTNAFIQQFKTIGNTISFNARCDSINEYCLTPQTDFYSPVYVGKVPNQNLHSIMQADYVIVTHPTFLPAAQRLAALHQKNEGYTSAIATTDQIYNEFSSGRQDISAIRDFVRMIYKRNFSSGKPVKYVCLMGDGSYKNKIRSLLNNSNVIPTYQSHNSLSFTNSVATDDFFGLMSDDEGYDAEGYGTVDLGVGRLTCRSVTEVNAVVTKIENYYKKDDNFKIADQAPENCNTNETTMSDWRNWLLFLADDKDWALHMRDANKLTNVVRNKSSLFNIDKVFLDAYQRLSTPGGKRYPDAEEDLKRRVKKGILIFNYTGHGGEVGLTEERMVNIPSINAFDNFNKLFLFITATCEFSRYDDPARTSAGELCLLNPKGGAIALFTTCRLAYSTPNYTLNETLLKALFTKKNGKWPTLGDCIQATKSSITQDIYYANFHLLGDPAMPLAYPQQKVVTSEINSTAVSGSSSDTLSALAKVTIKGFVADTLGNKLTNYNGIVYSSVFDKENTAVCLLNDYESSVVSTDAIPFQFQTQKNILYRGKSQVTNGDFSLTFIVPKDISFASGRGRISYYATNGSTDASGSYSNVIVGGISKNVSPDYDGPQINLYLNDKNFVNGGTTNEKPVLIANLVDSSGINTAGNSIGHDISVVLDATGNSPVVLNDYYEANLNSYQSGVVRYPFSDIPEGEHRLSFKVWDIQNNSTTVDADFIVAKSAELALRHVLNYPNPFTTQTQFFFEHNQACTPLRITIQVYTISGKVVKTIQKSVTCEGYRPEGIEWDGKDDFGDKLARGVYIYKLAILNTDNKKAEKIEKLVILN